MNNPVATLFGTGIILIAAFNWAEGNGNRWVWLGVIAISVWLFAA